MFVIALLFVFLQSLKLKYREMSQKEQNVNNAQAVGEAVSGVEKFLKKNGKVITWAVVGVIALVAILFAYHNWVKLPNIEEAKAQMMTAEEYFRANDYEQALNGDGNALGFVQVLDEYGTKAGKDIYFYAGVCELQLGNYQAAIDYLKKYNGKDKIILGRAQCCIADAYVGLEKYSDALKGYKNAAATSDNEFSAQYLLKAGILCEEMGNADEALSLYEEIKVKYPQTIEASEIDKYISRLK